MSTTASNAAPAFAAPEASHHQSHLQVQGTTFVDAAGRHFEWRGITAFRLAEMIAHDRERDAIAFLDWAAKHKLTVVRVLLMAHHLFQLSPDEGVRALPRLLDLANARGLYVEVVAFADTAEIKLDHERHVKAIADIVTGHGNALVEIANEPWHPTQDTRLHDPAYAKRLADLIPATVPVALGSAETDAGYAAGRYATWHSPRETGNSGWQHVRSVVDGAKLLIEWRKPVVSDEPIGAGPVLIPGRRDNDPERFRAEAVLAGLIGFGLTFHYEAGLHAKIPEGRERECFMAWREGAELTGPPPARPRRIIGPSTDESPVRSAPSPAAGTFVLLDSENAWVIGTDTDSFVEPEWKPGWTVVQKKRWPRSYLVHARRQ
jgi:hypothetical protein